MEKNCPGCGKTYDAKRSIRKFCSHLCARRGREIVSVGTRFDKKFLAGGPDDCWPWVAGKRPKGYGSFSVGRRGSVRSYAASRWALARATGALDQIGHVTTELHALHTCDNPSCVNPAHLYWGTNDDNVKDKVERGRTPSGASHHSFLKPDSVSRGETKKRSRLKTFQVLEIRELYATGSFSQEQLAFGYGVSRTCIQCVVERRTWRHV